jgi:hypothetical protein
VTISTATKPYECTWIDVLAICDQFFICYYMDRRTEPAQIENGGSEIMKKNVGGIDKVLRFIVGIVLALVGFFVEMSTGLRVGVFVVAAIALITAFTGF